MEFTKKQKSISQHNRNLARKHFFGSTSGKPGWVLHHVDETMKERDPERYIQWNIEDLVPMTNSEHVSHHKMGNKYGLGKHPSEESIRKMKEAKSEISDETREKMRLAQLGKHASDEARAKMSKAKIGNKNRLGKKCSEESRERMRQSHLGKPLADETREKLSEVRKGMKFWNDGHKNVRARECPEGFVPGKIGRG